MVQRGFVLNPDAGGRVEIGVAWLRDDAAPGLQRNSWWMELPAFRKKEKGFMKPEFLLRTAIYHVFLKELQVLKRSNFFTKGRKYVVLSCIKSVVQ